MGKYAISYDIGTTGVKTCIFELGDTIKLVSVPGMCEDLNTKQLFLDLLVI